MNFAEVIDDKLLVPEVGSECDTLTSEWTKCRLSDMKNICDGRSSFLGQDSN